MRGHRVLIVGSGPAGIAIGIQLTKRGISFDVVDRYGVIGGAYARMSPTIELASPPAFLKLDESSIEHSAEFVLAGEYADYLKSVGDRFGINPSVREVVSISAEQSGAHVAFDDGGSTFYTTIILATGMYDFPVTPSLSGVDRMIVEKRAVHASSVMGIADIPAGNVLVVGSGMRGIEIAEGLANAGRTVAVSSRKGTINARPRQLFGLELRSTLYRFQGLLPRVLFPQICSERSSFGAIDRGIRQMLRDGRVGLHPALLSIESGACKFADEQIESYAHIIFATGHLFQLPPVYVDGQLSRANPSGNLFVKSPPIFLLGYPCSRHIDSSFIYGIKRDASAIAKQIVRIFDTLSSN